MATLSRGELRTWFLLVSSMRSLLNALDRQFRDEVGVTHDDYEILSRLHRASDRTLRMSELAHDVGFSPSRLSHAVGRMEEAGWVSRAPCPTDRRGTNATLSDLGVKMVNEVTPIHLDLVKRLVFGTLGPDRARETAEAMGEVGRVAGSRQS